MVPRTNDEKKRSSTFYQSQGISIGIALGLIFGVALDQIAVGLVLGIAVGVGMGRTLELQAQKKKDEET